MDKTLRFDSEVLTTLCEGEMKTGLKGRNDTSPVCSVLFPPQKNSARQGKSNPKYSNERPAIVLRGAIALPKNAVLSPLHRTEAESDVVAFTDDECSFDQ